MGRGGEEKMEKEEIEKRERKWVECMLKAPRFDHNINCDYVNSVIFKKLAANFV
jgi:hypothetical protein